MIWCRPGAGKLSSTWRETRSRRGASTAMSAWCFRKRGPWEVVNQRLQDFGNGFEASSTYRVPLDRLERLAEACREVATRFEASRTYETIVRGSTGRSGGSREDFEVRYAATGQELTDSMLTLAAFAEEAQSAGRRIFAVLK